MFSQGSRIAARKECFSRKVLRNPTCVPGICFQLSRVLDGSDQGRMDGGKSLTGEGLTLKPRFAEGARGSAEGVSKNLIFLL